MSGWFKDDEDDKPQQRSLPLNETGFCKFCGRALLWVSTESGARMPLDKEFEERFVVEAGTSPMRARKRRTYTCHFDTCTKKGGR